MGGKCRHIARFTLLDGSCQYVRPQPKEIDEEASVASRHLVLAAGADPLEIFSRETFGAFSVRSGGAYGIPEVHSGIFFSYNPRFVGKGRGATIDGQRTAFRFEVIPRVVGYLRVDWSPAFRNLGRSAVKHKLLALRRIAPKNEDVRQVVGDVDPKQLAAEVLAGPRVFRATRIFGSYEEFRDRLQKEPATTLITLGLLEIGKGSRRGMEALRDEWASVVLRLARQGLNSVRRSPGLELARHWDAKCLRMSYASRARAIFDDMVQEGFLKLLEIATTFQPNADQKRPDLGHRFDKIVFTRIQWAIKNRAAMEMGVDPSTESLAEDVLEEALRSSPLTGTVDLRADDEVDYTSLGSSGVEALRGLLAGESMKKDARDLFSGRIQEKRLRVMADQIKHFLSSSVEGSSSIDVSCEARDDEERLVAAAGIPIVERRFLTDTGVIVKRWLDIEASLASGNRRPVVAQRLSLEVSP